MNFQRVVHGEKRFFSVSVARDILGSGYRRLSTMIDKNPSTKISSDASFSKEEQEEFMSSYPQVVADITNLKPYDQFPSFTSSTKALLDYNVTCGNQARGLITVYAFKMLVKPQNLTEENLKKALMLGWIFRIIEASVCIMDDFLDNSPIRNSRPSWYTLPGVGKKAPLHSFFLESCMFHMLEKYFSSHPQYSNMVDTILNISKYLNYSQCLDTQEYCEEYQTYEYMEANSLGKAGYSAYYPLVTFAMYLANIQDIELYGIMKKILLAMGHYFQIQNDYLDSFGDPRKRQLGVDIKEARITWLSATAFKKCNSSQKQIFRENFGKDSHDSVSQILNLYHDLGMQKVYQETEEQLNDNIWKDIKRVPNDVIPHAMFHRLLNNLKQALCTSY